MFIAILALSFLGFFIIKPVPCDAAENPCPDGRLCPAHWLCCEVGCCAPGAPSRRDDEPHKELPYYPWYAQWSVLFLLGTLGGIVLCCAWCLLVRRSAHVYACSLACCVRRRASEHDSAGSVYPPPHYSRCGSFHQAPPPYSEVTSKPDLYPLVITCGDGDGKGGGNYLMVHYFRNYVIRAPGSLSATSTAESLNSSFICNAANEANSIIPPPYSCASNYSDCGVACGRSLLRSLSSLTEPRAAPVLPLLTPPGASCATGNILNYSDCGVACGRSLLRSLSSLTEPRAAPVLTVTAPAIAAAPARSRTTSDSACARSRAESQAFRDNLITSPVQPLDPSFDLELELIDCEMYCDGGCKPRLGASPPGHRSPGAPEPCPRAAYAPRPPPPAPASPPRPTSPTQSQDSTRRPSDERRPRKKPRKSSLYMPLSVAYPTRTRPSPGARVSSRSAPATPCGALPNLLTFTQRVSASRVGSRSSRFEEESNPLLADIENARTDHKF